MKRLSDYKGADAIKVWGELLKPASAILGDKEIAKAYKKSMSRMEFIALILQFHDKEVSEMLLAIDPTPIDGINIITRVLENFEDLQNSEEMKGFFGSAWQVQTVSASTGSATVNTKAKKA